MERANTIAIYEANSTFVGHYQEQEKMNVIQLWVTDDGTGTPFQKGPNAIVISTSLFGNTKLHSMLEKEQLQQTPLWSPISGDYQFIAVDRDKNSNSDGASNNVDFVIIRRAISSAQAMEVLDLLLTCYVNESIDEATNLTVYDEAILYTYASTKINGIKAVKMNLHVDVLGFVPYFSDYKNSEQGQEPNNKTKLTAEFVLVVAGIIAAIVVCAVAAVYSGGGTALLMMGFICMLIYMLDAYLPGIADILAMIIAFMMELVMTVLTWLGPLGWLILRAALLVLIWIMHALTVALMNIVLLGVSSIINILSVLMDIIITTNSDYVKTTGDLTLLAGYDIDEEYNSTFDLNVPKVRGYFNANNISFELRLSYFMMDLQFDEFCEVLWNKTIKYTIDLLSGIGFSTGFVGGVVSGVSGGFSVTEDSMRKQAVYFAGLVLLIASVVIFLIIIIKYPEKFTSALLMGLGIGLVASGIVFFAVRHIVSGGKYMYKWAKLFGTTKESLANVFSWLDLIGLFLGFVDVGIGLYEIFWATDNDIIKDAGIALFSFCAGTSSLFFATNAIINWPKIVQKDKKKISTGFAIASLILGAVLISFAVKLGLDEN